MCSIGMEIHTFYPSRERNSQRRRFRNESLTMGSIGYITCHTIQKQEASQSWDGLLKAQLKHHCGDSTLQRRDIIYSLNQRPPYRAIFTTESVQGSRNKGEVGVAPFTIIPKDPLEDYALLIPGTLGSAELEVQLPKGSTLSSGHSKGPTEPVCSCCEGTLDLYSGNSGQAGLLFGGPYR